MTSNSYLCQVCTPIIAEPSIHSIINAHCSMLLPILDAMEAAATGAPNGDIDAALENCALAAAEAVVADLDPEPQSTPSTLPCDTVPKPLGTFKPASVHEFADLRAFLENRQSTL